MLRIAPISVVLVLVVGGCQSEVVEDDGSPSGAAGATAGAAGAGSCGESGCASAGRSAGGGGAVPGGAAGGTGSTNSTGGAGTTDGSGGTPSDSTGGASATGGSSGGLLIDLDLTRASAAPCAVHGGSWQDGWRVTSSRDQIVCDAGRNLSAGSFSVSFIINAAPYESGDKRNWIGAYEHASLNQNASGFSGDWFYARTGQAKYGFSRLKAFYRPPDTTEWEHTIGATSDWKTNDATVMTVKWEFSPGKVVFVDPNGNRHTCSDPSICGQINALRYFFVGTDNYAGGGGAPIGLCVTSLRLEENQGG
jgi:hypothetical protein